MGLPDSAGLVALTQNENDSLQMAAVKNLGAEFIKRFDLRVGESFAGRVVQDGRPRVVTDLAADPRTKLHDLRELKKLQSLIAVPMRAEGKIIGALVIYTRRLHKFSDEDTDFFVTLGGQAAIAVQNAQLYERTKSQAVHLAELARELETNYTATLAAMSAALDARDRETQGHSQRVADQTCDLARALGVTDSNELAAIQRGALLHDIVKIGISDNILLKAGPLTPKEWHEMKKHPTIGTDMLRNIRFLKDAIPIVFHHQERWDGSGYPDGLKGQEIPLSARIFAVVDAYDALTSNRPYRPALSPQAAIDEIRAKSGTEFDPRIVDKFTEIVSRS